MKRYLLSCLGTMVIVSMSVLAAGAQPVPANVPVLQVQPGTDGRESIAPPAGGFEPTGATSDNGFVTVEQPNNAFGGWGVNFQVSTTVGNPALVTVTWKNKQTGEERHTFFIVTAYPVESATSIQVASDATVTVDAPPNADVVTGYGLRRDGQRGAKLDGKKLIITPSVPGGTGKVIVDTTDHKVYIIVVDVPPKPAVPPAAPPKAPATPPPAKSTPEKEGGGD